MSCAHHLHESAESIPEQATHTATDLRWTVAAPLYADVRRVKWCAALDQATIQDDSPLEEHDLATCTHTHTYMHTTGIYIRDSGQETR